MPEIFDFFYYPSKFDLASENEMKQKGVEWK